MPGIPKCDKLCFELIKCSNKDDSIIMSDEFNRLIYEYYVID